MIVIILSFIFSFTVLANDYEIPLDAHFHYRPTSDEIHGIRAEECNPPNCEPDITYKDFLSSNEAKTALLISDSFDLDKNAFDHHENGEDHIHPLYRWKNKEELIPLIDKRVSDITQEYPGRFVGICGLNYGWEIEDAIERIKACLNLPGMKGVKLHSYASKDEILLREIKSKKLVKGTFNAIKEKNPIIIWHIFVDSKEHCKKDSPKNCGKEEIDFLFEMAQKYPNFTFIIAHSMYSTEAIEYLVGLEQKHGKLSNVFLETSEANSVEKVGKAWMKFGLERVLYGSDNFDWSRSDFHKMSGLTQDQTSQIEQDNGHRFLQRINNSERNVQNKQYNIKLNIKDSVESNAIPN